MASLEGLIKATYSLGWIYEGDIPVIGCRRAKKPCWRIVSDYWLASTSEKRIVEGLVQREFGARIGLEDRLVVFHRVELHSADYAVEVYAESSRLGFIAYFPSHGWALYPTAMLANLLVHRGAKALSLHRIEPDKLKGRRLLLDLDGSRTRWVILDLGSHVAVAKVIGRNTVKVRDVAPKQPEPTTKGGLEEAVRVNEEIHGGLASEARHFIRRIFQSYSSSGRVAVALGGDEASVALLSLAREALGNNRVTALHVESEFTPPETKRYVEKIASILDVELQVVEPGSAIELVAEKGLMSLECMWCKQALRVEPLVKAAKKAGINIVLEGARKWGTRTQRLGKYPNTGILRALPLYHWPKMAIQLYLYERTIPLNQFYHEGIHKVNCLVCPKMNIYEIHKAYSLHKDSYLILTRALSRNKNWRDKRESLLSWILSGEWRKNNCRK